jgi:hypothetical protein
MGPLARSVLFQGCSKFRKHGRARVPILQIKRESQQMPSTDLDLAAAHRHFSAACFSGVWELIDKPNRSPDEDRLMVSMCHASLYHWQQRPDCTPRNLSIGYWQLSRVYAVLEQADNARHYGQHSLTHSRNEDLFYLGYAHEALARAEALAGNRAEAETHLATARDLAAQVTDAGERELLEADLVALSVIVETPN